MEVDICCPKQHFLETRMHSVALLEKEKGREQKRVLQVYASAITLTHCTLCTNNISDAGKAMSSSKLSLMHMLN